MRAMLGLLVLGGLFLMAATWQGRATARLREQRAREFGVPVSLEDVRAGREGWSELVLGRPSGAAPLALPIDASAPAQGAGVREGGGAARQGAPSSFARDFEYVVKARDVLSVVCQKHYGKGRLREIVPAVARYNDLSDANDIVEGQTILLPDVARLLGEN